MSQRAVTTGLITGSLVAAWLRFDVGSAVRGWCVVLMCITGAAAAWIINSRRLPSIQLPPKVEALAGREDLTAREEAEFRDALREWHRHQQAAAFHELARDGPGSLIRARGALYFLWLSFFALAVVPRGAVPSTFLPQLPRF